MSGKRRILVLTKRQIKTGDNALPLTAFALAFSPVDPLSENDGKTTTLLRKKLVRLFSPREPRFRRRCAPLKVSLWRRMSGKRQIFILTKRQQAKPVFSSRSSFGKTGRQRSHSSELSLAEGEYHCFSGIARKTFRTSSLFTITYNLIL